jgi:hypothetical protein
VDENFPAAEQAGRQFSKTVFSDELVEQTAGDRSSTSEDGVLIPSPHNGGYAKASSAAGSVELSTKSSQSVVPPKIPPPPPAKLSEKKQNTTASPSPHTLISNNPSSDSPTLSDEQNPQTAPTRARESDDQTTGNTRKRQEKDSMIRSAELDHSGERKPQKNQPSAHVDWTTRITLALLLAGLLLLGYVVLV